MAAGPASSAARPHPDAKVAVPQGIGSAVLSGDPVFGNTPPGTKETVSFILKARARTPGHVFNPAAGLGTPDLAALARHFARS
jgi:hypothetical protein